VAKHIHRIPKDEPQKKQDTPDLSDYEEWKFVAGIEPRPESLDPLLVKERTIAFSNKSKKTTKEERVKEKSDEFRDQVTNTDQYFRFANGIIKEKLNKLRHLKENDKKFFDELGNLQNKIKTKAEIDKLNPKYLTSHDAKALIMYLEEDYEKMKDKLLYQELIVQKTKDMIATKRKEISQIKEMLKEIIQRRPKQDEITDPIAVLKEELRKAGVDEKHRIFKVIDDIAESLDMKYLKDQLNKG
jgi:hypothetical protein